MTPADIKAIIPELVGETDARVQLYIGLAEPHFNVQRWGGFYSAGVANWVAHEITLVNMRAAKGGAVKAALTDDTLQKKVGDLQTMRDTGLLNKQADNPYYRTVFGQQYLELRKLVGAGAAAV